MAGASPATLYAQNVPSTPTHSGNGSMSAPPQEVVLLHKAHPDQSLGLGLSNVEGSPAPVVARVRGVARAAGVRVGDLVVAVVFYQKSQTAKGFDLYLPQHCRVLECSHYYMIIIWGGTVAHGVGSGKGVLQT